jgi:hypothetical protein
MDFEDTPAESAFRAEVRGWLDSVAEVSADVRVAIFAEDQHEAEIVRQAKEWQRKLADAGGPESPGPRSSADGAKGSWRR